jgi:predicted O-linked N-acetylglucosamine transferase (SPINDLY family)
VATLVRGVTQAPPAAAPLHRLLTQGLEHHRAGRWADAERLYREVLAADPANVDALHLLGMVAGEVGDLAAAVALIGRALELAPGVADFHGNLGTVHESRGDLAAAEAALRRAVALAPGTADFHSNLGNVLKAQGRLAEAVASYARALALCPDHPQAHNNLGTALTAQRRFAEAAAHYRRALALDPGYAEAHSNLIFALDLDPDAPPSLAFAERRRWNAVHAAPNAATLAPHPNDRTPERRLRVGYVSADFRRHSAATGFAPLILAHDRERFDVVCYSGVARPDELTERFRAAATAWRSTLGVSDERLAATIRDDAIDILVDLAGHSAGHRLRAFARRPAPIQCTGWGHAAGTGLDAIDYLFADAVTAPPADRALFREEIVELPALIAYAAPEAAPEPGPLPAPPRGHVTFGCLNRPWKVTDATLAVWAEILRRLPAARLVMKFVGLDAPAAQQPFREALTARGIGADRVLFLGGSDHAAHLATYRDIDIGLDPFPHGGGVTALEALWMGVPFVTRLGDRIAGRMGASLLDALGLHDWVATGADDYVRRAVRHATDLDALATLRAGLRARLAASPLCDHRAYCRAVEDAYRAMWRRWCASAAA